MNAASCCRGAAILLAALAVLILSPVVTAGSPAPAARGAETAKPCRAQAVKLAKFKRTTAAKRKVFFRRHVSAKKRQAFVKKQRTQLKALQRALARCRKRAAKKPNQPPPSPPPTPPDTTPPALVIEAPAEGEWLDAPRAAVRGTATDFQSGVQRVTCNGTAAALAGAAFACDVALSEGVNQIVVRAIDGARNEATSVRRLEHRVGGLAGPPTAPALDAMKDVLSDDARVAPAETEDGVVRTHLQLVLAPDAAVEQVNRLLASVGGRIVASLDDNLIPVIRIPDPGSVDAVRAVAEKLGRDAVVRAVHLSRLEAPNVLPELIGPADLDELAHIGNHLAVRGPAAWNARALLAGRTRPTFVLADAFGSAPPDNAFGVDVLTPADFAVGVTDPTGFHGYHVLGIAAASFNAIGAGAGSIFREFATGIFPAADNTRLPVRAVDILQLQGAAVDVAIVQRAKAAAGAGKDVILNTSIGFDCSTPPLVEANCNEITALAQGSLWAKRIRDAKLEDRMLHVASAGNVDVPGDTRAAVNSSYVAAAMLPIFDPVTGNATGPLSNTLVIENQIASTPTVNGPVQPLCLSRTSKRPGHLSAIGTDVFSLTQTATDVHTGTSQATPQVAGLAAYLWTIDSSLSPQRIATRLRAAARSTNDSTRPDCDPAAAQPAIDAYATVLAGDTGDPDLPVREAILDQDDSLRFDQDDLTAFVDAFATAAGAVDYSRYDLNGDGRTGGAARDRFDLNVDFADDKWSDSQEQTIQTIPVRFEDARLTDLDILCWYAHSDLYRGTTAVRDQFAAEKCLAIELDATFPSTVASGVDTPLVVRAIRPNGLAQPRVHLTLLATGGSVADTAGFTGPDGAFRTNARRAAGSELSIQIVAHAGSGGPELARTTVRAVEPPALGISSNGHIDGRVQQRDGPVLDSFSRSSGNVASWTDGDSANDSATGATGRADGTFTVSTGAFPIIVNAQGNASAQSGAPAQMADGNTSFTAEFVLTEPTGYSATGSVSAGLAGSVFCCSSGEARLFGEENVFVVSTEDREGTKSVARSGTLAPGLYRLLVQASVGVGFGAIASPSTSGTAAFNIRFTLGP